MPRRPRQASGGRVYHVLNRGAGRRVIFEAAGDSDAFERILAGGGKGVGLERHEAGRAGTVRWEGQ